MTQEAGVPKDFWGRIERMIDQSVAKLARSGMQRNSSMTGGTFTIKGGRLRVRYPESEGGGDGVYFGDLYSSGAYIGTGYVVQGADGKNMLEARSDAAGGHPVVAIRDDSANILLYANNITGQGLGRPYLPSVFYPSRGGDFLGTTSTTFEHVYRAKMYKQHASLHVRLWAFSDTAGAAGEVRVMVNGVQLGGTAETDNASISEYSFYGPVDGAHMAPLTVEIQARVATGAGQTCLQPSALDGRI